MGLRLSLYRFSLRAWFYALPALAFVAAFFFRTEYSSYHQWTQSEWGFHLTVVAFASLVWAIAAERNRLCEIEGLFQEYSGFYKCLFACGTTYVALTCLLFFYRQESMSRAALALSAVLLFAASLLSRVGFRLLLGRRFRSENRLRVLIVGADQHAATIAKRLRNIAIASCEIVAHVSLPGQKIVVHEVPTYTMEEVQKGLPVRVDDVIIALSPERLSELSDVVRHLGAISAPIRTVLDLGDVAVIRERWFQFGDLQLLDVAASPVESPNYFLAKRAFDITFSLLVLLLTSPLMLIIAGLVKLTSTGPVLFRQQRVGLNGQQFWMYKLRTMRHTDTSESDVRWTTADDHRRTRVGALLRKTSLDELPQFFNVLKGDMSVVGPRPERPYFVNQFLQEFSHYNARHRLKVGITGWAQVNGWRGDTSIQKRFEFDLYYLQNWSLWFDVRIVWMTIWSGLFHKNAY
ncbi:MAG: undecaprenyl-phosphate glucose phosphotransferase [Candidatus Korobacteraceae bacterium]